MYFTTNSLQNSNRSKLYLLVRSYTYTTPSAFRKQVGSMDSQYSPAPISQHTISYMLSLSEYSPQNLRLASCTPTVGLENYRKVPLQNRFLILVFPAPTSPTNTILIFSQLSVLDSIIQQNSSQFLLITFMTTDNNEQIDFERYQLIPRDEVLRPPNPDHSAQFNTKPYSYSKASSKTQDFRSEEQKQRHQKLLLEKEQIINSLQLRITQLETELKSSQDKNHQLMSVVKKIKIILTREHILDEEIASELESIMKKVESANTHKCKQNKNYTAQMRQIEELLVKKQQDIRQLKAKLLESTANNINAIFGTQANDPQPIIKQILGSKQDLNKKGGNLLNKSECRHEEKILNLIKSYEQMLKLYHENQKSVYELKNKQEQNFAYFSSLHSQLNHSIHQVSSNYTNQRLNELEYHIKSIVDNIKNAPQRAKTEHQQDIRVKELLNQIENLNERVTQRQIQMEKMRQSNQELMRKSRAHEKCYLQMEKLKKVQQKMREKDKRISQLENTIIEQMDSRIKDDSINSQESDVEKQKNNIRNLKALVGDLRQQNKSIKTKMQEAQNQNKELKKMISNLSSTQSGFHAIEKVHRDEPSFKLVEDILNVLINAVGKQTCKCLQLTTDCLLNLNDEYPQLQLILEELGIIQKTMNLLPVHI